MGPMAESLLEGDNYFPYKLKLPHIVLLLFICYVSYYFIDFSVCFAESK